MTFLIYLISTEWSTPDFVFLKSCLRPQMIQVYRIYKEDLVDILQIELFQKC